MHDEASELDLCMARLFDSATGDLASYVTEEEMKKSQRCRNMGTYPWRVSATAHS